MLPCVRATAANLMLTNSQRKEEEAMDGKEQLNEMDKLEIEPLSDEALEMVAGGKESSSGGTACCSCQQCSNKPTPTPVQP